jgi:5-methylcytosine-specific restriction endonuclease McrA
MINLLGEDWADRLTPRQRLSHKLRDGTYRARHTFDQPTESIPVRHATRFLAQKTCYYCGTDVSDYYELEHKTPLQRGGQHVVDNLAKSCGYCNEHKGTMTEDEYREWLAGGFSVMQEPQVERMYAA